MTTPREMWVGAVLVSEWGLLDVNGDPVDVRAASTRRRAHR